MCACADKRGCCHNWLWTSALGYSTIPGICALAAYESEVVVDVLREWVVVVALLFTALAIPLIWHHVDSTRRMNLKQTAYAGCLTHHDLAGCARMRPAEVDPATVTLCEMRFDPRECAQLREAK